MASGKTYATWNPSDKGSEITLSGGNLVATKTGSTSAFTNGGVRSTLGKSSGKWYFEFVYTEDGGSNWPIVGIGNSSANMDDHVGSDANGWGIYAPDGDKYHSDSGEDYGTSFVQGDVIGVALNMDSGKVWFSKNGTWMNSGDPAAGTGEAYSGISGTIYAMIVIYQPSGSAWTAKFGAAALSYSAPSGFNSGLYNSLLCIESVMGKTNCVKIAGKTKAQYVKVMGISTGLQVIGQSISADLGAGPTVAIYGDDLVASDHNHTGTVVNTVSIDGGSSYGSSKALGCPAEVKAVKLKSVDDFATRIQDLSVTLTDNSAICEEEEAEYEPGPGTTEVLEEHFEGSGAEVAWTKVETDGTVGYDQATTEETWGDSCARFTLNNYGTELQLTKSFTATQSLYCHIEFVVRAIDFSGGEGGSAVLIAFEGGSEATYCLGPEVKMAWSAADTDPFELYLTHLDNTNGYQADLTTDLSLAVDGKHSIDIKWDNKVGGNVTFKVDGVQKKSTAMEYYDQQETPELCKIDRMRIGFDSFSTIINSITLDVDNIRVTTDDWA